MHLHILGIGGVFMGGIAALAKEAGHYVSGSDGRLYPPMSEQLGGLGVKVFEGFDTDPQEIGADLYIVGNVVSRGNPLMELILDRGLPYVSGPEWLRDEILASRWVIALAGTHGKTTTTAMVAWILEDCGLRPGFLVGGVPGNFSVSARTGGTPFFVIEADEYDTAFFDKRSKFVHYRPRTAVLNNLEYDHADIFPDLSAIETQFHHLLRTVPRSGQVIYNGKDTNLKRVLGQGLWSESLCFDCDEGLNARMLEAGRFVVLDKGREVAEITWGAAGRHNVSNALAAMAAARHVGVPLVESAKSLAGFKLPRRRLEMRGEVNGVTVIDDFAHHPTAIRASIEAMAGRGRVLAVLEPRSNTMRMGIHGQALADSLKGAERAFIYAGDSSWKPDGSLGEVHDDIDALVASLVGFARTGDRILVMSNGGFGGIHERLLDALARL